MTIKKLTLMSPEGSPIVGALCEDASICPLSVFYDSSRSIIDLIYEKAPTSNLRKVDGKIILVDKNDKEWPECIVIDQALFGK